MHPLRPTLLRHLLGWVLGALAVVWASFLAVGYRTGAHEADELTDGHLASVASLLVSLGSGTFTAANRPVPPPGTLRSHDYQQSLSVIVWDREGQVVTRTGDAPLPAFDSPEGFTWLDIGQPPGRWRAYSRWDEARARKVMVLLSQAERDDLATDIAEQVTEPAFWLLPVIALLLGLAIRRGLGPLYELSGDVRAMDVAHGRALGTKARHEEFTAVVDAINALAGQYHATLSRERDLAGEFAHELRTPLASIALQARAIPQLPDGDERRAALARLEQDALRAGEVLSHLLALARASRTDLDEAARPVDLQAVAQQVLGDFAPAAHATGHTLGLSSPGPLVVQGHAVLLELALRNLVENAISHTPHGTQVEVEIDPARRCLSVCDHSGAGTGAPPAGGGLRLGLGHRVVEKVAAIHGATFDSTDADGRRCYSIHFGSMGA